MIAWEYYREPNFFFHYTVGANLYLATTNHKQKTTNKKTPLN